jgi:putative ABC transport system substrate-binding protein
MNRILFIFSVAVIAYLTSCSVSPKKITIGYVQIAQDPVLDAAKAGVLRALADSGFVDGEKIKVVDNNAQGDLSMINMILKSFQSQNVDMVITNSTPCMVAAAYTIKDIPVVFTVAIGPEQLEMKTIPENLYGVYDPLDVSAFADLMQECLPNLKRIGIPYNNAEPNAEYSVKKLSKEFSSRGITLVTASVTSTNDIIQAGQYLSGQQIDAFLTAADNTISLGLPVLVKLATENKIPLFAMDPMQTKRGASVGLGVDYYQWGYLTGLKAVEILKGRGVLQNKISPIEKGDLTINVKACEEQGLLIPEKVLARGRQVLN